MSSRFTSALSYIASPAILEKASGLTTTTDLVAEVGLPAQQSLNSYPSIVVLNQVNDPGNVGTLVRTALAMGWDGVFLLEGTADPFNDKALRAAQTRLSDWPFTPSGTEGYAKAEVTAGGISTAALSSQSMMAKAVPGLYAIGEAVDVTGWLGGYNFQWAWASGHAAGMAL